MCDSPDTAQRDTEEILFDQLILTLSIYIYIYVYLYVYMDVSL